MRTGVRVAELRRLGVITGDEIRRVAAIYLYDTNRALCLLSNGHAIDVAGAIAEHGMIRAALADPALSARQRQCYVRAAILRARTVPPAAVAEAGPRLELIYRLKRSAGDPGADAVSGFEHFSDLLAGILDDCEQKVLTALSGDFVSTTVIKLRAGYPTTAPNDSVFAACSVLARLGLAERNSARSQVKTRWRRPETASFSPEAVLALLESASA